MDIVYLFQDPYPWDIRVEKIVTSLSDAGHNLHVVARNRGTEQIYELLDNRFDVYRLPRGFGHRSNQLLNFPAFFSPIWIGRLIQTVRRTQAGLIIVRDLPLAATALFVSRLTGVPVIMDMAENYPAMIESTWRFRGARPLDYLIRNPRLLKRLERFVVPRLSGVMVVSEASRRRVQSLKSTMPPVWVVGNTPSIERSAKHIEHPAAIAVRAHSGVKLLYVGFLEHMRGLEIVIRALPTLLAHGVEPLLTIVGDGEHRAELERLAASLGVASSVHFVGWIDQRFLPGIIAAADICLIPHYVTEHTDTTLPNKIFDYMAQAKPVVVSHAAALKDIVENYHCGATYTDTSPSELAGELLMLTDPERRKKLGEAGLKAVRQTFNWDVDRLALLEAVDHVGRRGISRPNSTKKMS